MNLENRYETYNKDHCWQYEIKLQTKEEDKKLELPDDLRTKDFSFSFIPKEDKETCTEIIKFINRYEWLGKMPIWVTHRFIARYQEHLGGVVVMATPNAFSKLLGDKTKNIEKLISRGASTSWTPKNMASWQLSKSMRWMVKNTPFRLFTAYSDPIAKELGTIYQATNFYYLGNTYGGGDVYFDPNNSKAGWVGSHYFHYRSAYVRYAKELGITWQPEWFTPKRKVKFKAMPEEIKLQLKAKAKEKISNCRHLKTPKKHKYAYVLGVNKRETKLLRKEFEERNVGIIKAYPKQR